MSGLERGHGASVVQTVENLAVEHDLGLVLRVSQHVQHVLTSAQCRAPVKVRPLENVGGLVLGHVTALDTLTIVTHDRNLDSEVVLALAPASTNV